MILLSMAWLVGEADEESPSDDPDDKEWNEVKRLLGYFALRCTPFWEKNGGGVFLECNRIGTEPGGVEESTSFPSCSALSFLP